MVTTSRTAALATTNDLAQAGANFNDATRLLVGGLWATPNDSDGQVAYVNSFTADIQSVLNTVTADLAAGSGGTITIGGNSLTLTAQDVAALQTVQTNLTTMLSNAQGAATFDAGAEQAIHTADAAVITAINGDSHLATALAQTPFTDSTGAQDVGFQALPAMAADDAAAITAATASGATLAEIGTVFNAATNLSVGGLNAGNMAEFTADLQAVATGVQNILNNPTQLAAIEAGETANSAALTTIHLQTIENQVNLQLNKFDGQYATAPNLASRATNDNLLDIIDIVQNDAALNANAGSGGNPSHTGGFAEQPGFLTGTTIPVVDNQAGTNFWAQFLSEANVINNQLTAEANGTGTVTVASLITEIQNYQQFGHNFDQAEGQLFGSRFDNELLSGTLLADTNAAVQGLTAIENGATGTALAAAKAQIIAAGHGFSADAQDVSGNNSPLGGGTYVGSATTIAGATSIAGIAQGTTDVGPTVDPTTGLTSGSVALQQVTSTTTAAPPATSTTGTAPPTTSTGGAAPPTTSTGGAAPPTTTGAGGGHHMGGAGGGFGGFGGGGFGGGANGGGGAGNGAGGAAGGGHGAGAGADAGATHVAAGPEPEQHSHFQFHHM